jgi:hypothetical protein
MAQTTYLLISKAPTSDHPSKYVIDSLTNVDDWDGEIVSETEASTWLEAHSKLLPFAK